MIQRKVGCFKIVVILSTVIVSGNHKMFEDDGKTMSPR